MVNQEAVGPTHKYQYKLKSQVINPLSHHSMIVGVRVGRDYKEVVHCELCSFTPAGL